MQFKQQLTKQLKVILDYSFELCKYKLATKQKEDPMRPTTRKVTVRLLSAIEDGDVSAETVVRACLNYMSEAEIADMCDMEGLLVCDEGVVFDEL